MESFQRRAKQGEATGDACEARQGSARAGTQAVVLVVACEQRSRVAVDRALRQRDQAAQPEGPDLLGGREAQYAFRERWRSRAVRRKECDVLVVVVNRRSMDPREPRRRLGRLVRELEAAWGQLAEGCIQVIA